MLARSRSVWIPAGVLFILVACAGADAAVDPGTPVPTEAPAAPPASASETPPAPETPDEEEVLAEGRFERIGYEGRGQVAVVDGLDGLRLKFVDFKVQQGPALRVYLSAAKAGSPEQRYVDDFVDLGELKAFEGDQMYDVPAGTDIDKFRSAVIWCAEFDVGFVVAPLEQGSST